jgi:AcrR family transcriptional regulator
MSARRDPERPATDEQLVAEARRLFAERGYAGTSVRAIAEAAGVRPATLYAHFPSKAALFGLAVAGPTGRAKSVVLADEAADSPDRLAAAVEAIYRSLLEEPGDARLVTVELDHLPDREATRQRADLGDAWDAFAELVRQGAERGAGDPDAGELVAAIRAVGIGLLMPVDGTPLMPADDVIAANVRLALRLVRPRATFDRERG